MYALLLMAALTPDVPAAAPKASAGCYGSVKASAGCTGTVKAAPAAGCYGSVAVRQFRTPLRSAAHRVTAPRGTTTYLPAAAVYVPAATVYQSSAPPVDRAPVRKAAAAVVCPGGRCPR